jgi:hypothetical protein
MGYFDARALVKLVIEEEGGRDVAALWTARTACCRAGVAYPEVRAALAPARRDHRLPVSPAAAAAAAAAFHDLDAVASAPPGADDEPPPSQGRCVSGDRSCSTPPDSTRWPAPIRPRRCA